MSKPYRTHPKYPELRLFHTPNKRSPNWYAGFYHRSDYVRRSMGTPDLEAALDKAAIWYLDRQHEIRHGKFVAPGGVKFAKLVDPMLAGMAARNMATSYIRGVKAKLATGGYVDRFFGKLPVDQITTHSWDDFREWLITERATENKVPLAERTTHQMKNAVVLVLKHARLKRLIESKPHFDDTYRPKRTDARPRTQFNEIERMLLLQALNENVGVHEALKTRWVDDAKELRDFVRFMLETGLRVGEAKALKVRDVDLIKDHFFINGDPWFDWICQVRIVGGKVGAHPPCKSTHFAVSTYREILARRGIEDPSQCDEPLFKRHHRDAFRRLLIDTGLRNDAYGRRRDFVSLRHTYICERL